MNGCQILKLNSANTCIAYQGLRLFVVKWTENVIVYNEYEIVRYVTVVALVKALA